MLRRAKWLAFGFAAMLLAMAHSGAQAIGRPSISYYSPNGDEFRGVTEFIDGAFPYGDDLILLRRASVARLRNGRIDRVQEFRGQPFRMARSANGRYFAFASSDIVREGQQSHWVYFGFLIDVQEWKMTQVVSSSSLFSLDVQVADDGSTQWLRCVTPANEADGEKLTTISADGEETEDELTGARVLSGGRVEPEAVVYATTDAVRRKAGASDEVLFRTRHPTVELRTLNDGRVVAVSREDTTVWSSEAGVTATIPQGEMPPPQPSCAGPNLGPEARIAWDDALYLRSGNEVTKWSFDGKKLASYRFETGNPVAILPDPAPADSIRLAFGNGLILRVKPGESLDRTDVPEDAYWPYGNPWTAFNEDGSFMSVHGDCDYFVNGKHKRIDVYSGVSHGYFMNATTAVVANHRGEIYRIRNLDDDPGFTYAAPVPGNQFWLGPKLDDDSVLVVVRRVRNLHLFRLRFRDADADYTEFKDKQIKLDSAEIAWSESLDNSALALACPEMILVFEVGKDAAISVHRVACKDYRPGLAVDSLSRKVYAVMNDGGVRACKWDNPDWVAELGEPPGGAKSIACMSGGQLVAVSGDGEVLRYDDGWRKLHVDGRVRAVETMQGGRLGYLQEGSPRFAILK